MQSLSKKKHEALIVALQQLEEWLDKNPVGVVQDDMRQLEMLFAHYQDLISELGDCINAYQTLHKRLCTEVVAPQFRLIRSRIDQRALEYHRLKMCLAAIRSY